MDQAWSAAAHEQPFAAFLTSVKVGCTHLRCYLQLCCSRTDLHTVCTQVSRLLAVKARADDATFSIMHELPAQFHTVS